MGGCDGQVDGQMRLADAERPEEDDVVLALHEGELVQRVDLLPLDGGPELKSKSASVLIAGSRLERIAVCRRRLLRRLI